MKAEMPTCAFSARVTMRGYFKIDCNEKAFLRTKCIGGDILHDIEEIYNQYAKPVYDYLLSISRKSDLAEEMTAETFYRAFKNIKNFRDESSLKTWLFQIEKHVWYQELSHAKPTIELEQVELLSTEQTPEEYCCK